MLSCVLYTSPGLSSAGQASDPLRAVRSQALRKLRSEPLPARTPSQPTSQGGKSLAGFSRACLRSLRGLHSQPRQQILPPPPTHSALLDFSAGARLGSAPGGDHLHGRAHAGRRVTRHAELVDCHRVALRLPRSGIAQKSLGILLFLGELCRVPDGDRGGSVVIAAQITRTQTIEAPWPTRHAAAAQMSAR